MPQRLTDREKDLIWRGWRNGQTCEAIGDKIGKTNACVFLHLQRYGGIMPVRRKRRPDALTLKEREQIAKGLAARLSLREIGFRLSRSPSTISREVRRNSWRRGYDPHRGEKASQQRACRPKPCKLTRNPRLRAAVADGLIADWSPEQISGWLFRAYSDCDAMRVSHETIYKRLYVPTDEILGRDHLSKLRGGQKIRRCRRKTRKGCREHSPVANGSPLSERPAAADARSEPGHWEGDLLAGNHGSYLATLVDRMTRYSVLVRVVGKTSAAVINAIRRRIRSFPTELKRTLTWDRGSEMSLHAQFTRCTGIPVYFCSARSPWQRGSNENVNGLLRQYLPKGRDFSHLSQRQLDVIARKLNNRPKKVLDFRTPKIALEEVLR